MKENITVKGQKISYEIKDIDIYSIEYYPENPRINYIISKYPKNQVNQDLIEKELMNLDSTRERIADLEANKGLIDEVYVLRNQVVEGNTRLCAYRRLCKKHPEDPRWRKIKARVLQDNITEEQLFYILGIFHIKGKKEWDAYEKASYINKMINILGKSPEEICRQLGMQKKNLEATLKAYNVMTEKYLKNSTTNDEIDTRRGELKKFSYFDAFYRQKDLVENVEKAPEFMDSFVGWVKEDRFKNAQAVRDLPKILKVKKAMKTFLEGEPETAFDEARQILYEDRPDKIDKFYKKFADFIEVIENAEIKIIQEEIMMNKQKKRTIEACFKKFKKFCKDCNIEV
jgi:hypothetical protein